MSQQAIDSLKDAVVNMKFNDSPELAEKCKSSGLSAVDILNKALLPALDVVGKLFKDGDYFLPDVLMSVKAYEGAYKLIDDELKAGSYKARGKILMGTVEGDIHEIGKNILLALCQGNGFEVEDLGINVSPATFLEKAKEIEPDIIGMSALLTTTMPVMQKVIELFAENGLRDEYKFIVGGSPVNQKFADQIGADGYGEDAQSGIELIKRITE
ncbi:MAG: corrinoid protein [Deltaproteobacteria bacterium]|nr:corrinoid protein [Deltaproteobacteria bacterium]